MMVLVMMFVTTTFQYAYSSDYNGYGASVLYDGGLWHMVALRYHSQVVLSTELSSAGVGYNDYYYYY